MELGILCRNKMGRFEVNGQELTSGDPVDIFTENGAGEWRSGRIEFDHNTKAYYFHGDPSCELHEGMTARVYRDMSWTI